MIAVYLGVPPFPCIKHVTCLWHRSSPTSIMRFGPISNPKKHTDLTYSSESNICRSCGDMLHVLSNRCSFVLLCMPRSYAPAECDPSISLHLRGEPPSEKGKSPNFLTRGFLIVRIPTTPCDCMALHVHVFCGSLDKFLRKILNEKAPRSSLSVSSNSN